MINVSGHRIGTAEVESALVSHPAAAEAAVVPVPHPIKASRRTFAGSEAEARGLVANCFGWVQVSRDSRDVGGLKGEGRLRTGEGKRAGGGQKEPGNPVTQTDGRGSQDDVFCCPCPLPLISASSAGPSALRFRDPQGWSGGPRPPLLSAPQQLPLLPGNGQRFSVWLSGLPGFQLPP